MLNHVWPGLSLFCWPGLLLDGLLGGLANCFMVSESRLLAHDYRSLVCFERSGEIVAGTGGEFVLLEQVSVAFGKGRVLLPHINLSGRFQTRLTSVYILLVVLDEAQG